jgi:hypothetical protein
MALIPETDGRNDLKDVNVLLSLQGIRRDAANLRPGLVRV